MTRHDEGRAPLPKIDPAQRHQSRADQSNFSDRDGDIPRQRDERRRQWQRRQLPRDRRESRREGIEWNTLSGVGGRGGQDTVDGPGVHDLEVSQLRELFQLVRGLLLDAEKAAGEDFWRDSGMVLGWPERVAAGREMREKAA